MNLEELAQAHDAEDEKTLIEKLDDEAKARGLELSDVVKVDAEGKPIEYVEPAPDFDPLELLQHNNAQKVKTLESLGVQLGFTVMATRLEAAVELLFDTPEGMRDLDLAFEQKLAPMLDQIAAQVKAQLVARDAQQGAKLLSVPGGRND